MDIGKRIRDLREERGLTQREVARRAGLTPSGVGFIEHGQTRNPSAETVVAIARALGVPVEELLAAEEPVPLGDAPREAGPTSLEEERLKADSPTDPQRWEQVLASVRERQRAVEAKTEELIELSGHSDEVNPYQTLWALDEALDCVETLLLALPGTHRHGREITIDLGVVGDLGPFQEWLDAQSFYNAIVERLVEAGLVVLKERAGQKAEPVPVGIGA
jgi:transcriptional regulator with XRE-family HTH domain